MRPRIFDIVALFLVLSALASPLLFGYLQQVFAGPKTILVTAKQWEFIPNTIEANKGDKIKLIVSSIDVTHGFSIIGYGINVIANPGQPITVEFVADKSGKFMIKCTVVCSPSHDFMYGWLIIK